MTKILAMIVATLLLMILFEATTTCDKDHVVDRYRSTIVSLFIVLAGSLILHALHIINLNSL